MFLVRLWFSSHGYVPFPEDPLAHKACLVHLFLWVNRLGYEVRFREMDF